MDRDSYFWKVMAGELPPPRVAETLDIGFTHIDADAGTTATALVRTLATD